MLTIAKELTELGQLAYGVIATGCDSEGLLDNRGSDAGNEACDKKGCAT